MWHQLQTAFVAECEEKRSGNVITDTGMNSHSLKLETINLRWWYLITIGGETWPASQSMLTPLMGIWTPCTSAKPILANAAPCPADPGQPAGVLLRTQ